MGKHENLMSESVNDYGCNHTVIDVISYSRFYEFEYGTETGNDYVCSIIFVQNVRINYSINLLKIKDNSVHN